MLYVEQLAANCDALQVICPYECFDNAYMYITLDVWDLLVIQALVDCYALSSETYLQPPAGVVAYGVDSGQETTVMRTLLKHQEHIPASIDPNT